MKIVYPDGTTKVTPDLAAHMITARKSYINSCTGLGLTGAEMCKLLEKMGHKARIETSHSSSTDGSEDEIIEVEVPCTRPDVLHECDLMEDVAVGFGFDNLPRRFPTTSTVV